MDMTVQEISQTLRSLGNRGIAEHSRRFFKTGKGEYGEGDQFLGIRVPVLREQAKIFTNVPLADIQVLLGSVYHEERLCALLLLVQKFSKADDQERKILYDFYLKNTRHINNWDLVDLSAYLIVGAYLADKDRKPLYILARSHSLWERRIAIISTLSFIRKKQFGDTLSIAEMLLDDREDLMHKASGWMLREVGKRDVAILKKFLDAHGARMPRTMLRYAIEKLPQSERLKYLNAPVGRSL